MEVLCDRVPKWPFGHLNFWRFMLIYEGCVSPTEKVPLQKTHSATPSNPKKELKTQDYVT